MIKEFFQNTISLIKNGYTQADYISVSQKIQDARPHSLIRVTKREMKAYKKNPPDVPILIKNIMEEIL